MSLGCQYVAYELSGSFVKVGGPQTDNYDTFLDYTNARMTAKRVKNSYVSF